MFSPDSANHCCLCLLLFVFVVVVCVGCCLCLLLFVFVVTGVVGVVGLFQKGSSKRVAPKRGSGKL